MVNKSRFRDVYRLGKVYKACKNDEMHNCLFKQCQIHVLCTVQKRLVVDVSLCSIYIFMHFRMDRGKMS